MPEEKKATLKNFTRATTDQIETLWSDDSLRKMCTNAEKTAIIIGKLPPQRQIDLLSILSLTDILKDTTDFYLVYDAASNVTKVNLLFHADDKLGITDKIIESELRTIDNDALIQYIEENMINERNEQLRDVIKTDPAGFLQNKYAIDKFNSAPPKLSAFESSFSIFYNQKNALIKQQIYAVTLLDNFMSGGNVDLDEVKNITGKLRQISSRFNTAAIQELIASIEQNIKDSSSSENDGYSSDSSLSN